ncbi:Anaphase-promoting complex subunit 7 [Acorus calamus]|uniref:Anaphase-promoting complex subunit 7 n=1 Tax=Acorus calamus TaxID=4465 RepID=A0AAV9EQC1_ACOCL|nr:Anaphase-promoting complex subunit 7 [Acorus calamus]
MEASASFVVFSRGPKSNQMAEKLREGEVKSTEWLDVSLTRNKKVLIKKEGYVENTGTSMAGLDMEIWAELNPQNEAAKKGFERLEKQMKGVDPDAPEEDEEDDVEDADGEQDEAELL